MSKRNFSSLLILLLVLQLAVGLFAIPVNKAKASGNSLSITSDTDVYLSGSGITLVLASGSTLVSYLVDTNTLTVNLDSSSNVTVKSNNLYTLNNSQSSATKCSASPAYSYLELTATVPTTITITPSTTVACSGTAPVISGFGASPTSITSGQPSILSWSLSGADTVSIDNGIGSQSNASSSQTTVSPTQTTTYTLTAVNYIGTTTVQTTVTVSAPSSGGGGGGSVVSLPTIDSFSASLATIQSGQSSMLSWVVTGASTVNITPAMGFGSLNALSGTATATPASTTLYTLTASNSYGQTSSKSVTVTVILSGSSSPQSPPVFPAQSAAPVTTPSSSSLTYCLVNNSGTFYLILSGVRYGIANPGLLYSYGYGFSDAITDTSSYQTLPNGGILGPNDGALVKTPSSPTVYLISGGARHGFTSASVFKAQGYKFSSVLTIPVPQLATLTDDSMVFDPASGHLEGASVSSKGTIYLVGQNELFPYPSLSVFNSWNLKNNFSRVLPANAADLSLPVGSAVATRTSCSQ